MLNDIYETRQKFSKSEDFIDLISTDLSKIYSYPSDKLNSYIKKYIDSRFYEPDSKGILKARETISKYTNKKNINGKLNPDEIFITASTSESYNLIFQTLSKSNDTKEKLEVLLPNPGYPLFEQLTKYSNLEAKYYRQEESKNWEIDLNSIQDNITCKTKFLVLISPNNPTGSVISKEMFKKICQIASQSNIILIVDEVFNEFTYEKDISWDLSVFNLYPTLVMFKLNGISKLFSLPDLKLAWIEIYGNKEKKDEIVEELEINNDMFLSANSITQNILPNLFEDFSTVEDIKEMLIKSREIVDKTLQELNKDNIIEYILPTAGIHLILSTKKEYITNQKSLEEIEEEFVVRLTESEKVFIHPGFFYDYHSGGRLSFVMSIANDPNKLKTGLERLFKFLRTFNG